MRLVTYRHPATGNVARAGILQGDRVLDVNALTNDKISSDMRSILDRWESACAFMIAQSEAFARTYDAKAEVPTHIAVPVWEATLSAPLPEPRSLRVFAAFEQATIAEFAAQDKPIPPAWYESPAFSFCNPGSIAGPDEPVGKPHATSELDFRMELALVIGIGGQDIGVRDAIRHIAGFMLLNDWCARDLQRNEAIAGFGPAKSSDFATSLGPWLVTPDELGDVLQANRLHIQVVTRINGEDVGRGDGAAMQWSFADLIATASRDVALRPGDVIATGALEAGSLLQLGIADQAWLETGDEVEIEAEGLGRLRNRIA
jgi:fumarylacetoacetate (FAA) hydrolase